MTESLRDVLSLYRRHRSPSSFFLFDQFNGLILCQIDAPGDFGSLLLSLHLTSVQPVRVLLASDARFAAHRLVCHVESLFLVRGLLGASATTQV